MDACMDRLVKERAENQACPDDDERNKVLLTMLEFAAAEVAPDLFKAVAEEIGVDSLQETPFLKAYTVFDMIKSTSGDGNELEAVMEDFVATIVQYDETAPKASTVLNEQRSALLNEFRAQACIGKLTGPRKWNELPDLENADVKALEEAVEVHFPHRVDDEDVSSVTASTANELARFTTAFAELKKAKGTKRRDEAHAKALEAFEQLLEKHSWEKFLETLRLYISVMLYTVHDGPALLAGVRGAAILPGEAVRGRKQRRSQKYSMLYRVFRGAGGSIPGWNAIVNKNEAEGQEMLKSVLQRAEEFRPERAARGKRKAATHGVDEEEVFLEEDDFDEEAIYGAGEEDDFDSDDDEDLRTRRKYGADEPASPRGTPRSAKKKTTKRRLSYSTPTREDYEELISFDKYTTNTAVKKRRRKPVPWSQEETEYLLRGVEIFGLGQWAKILSHFGDVFTKANRTSVSLKDRYRNLEIRKTRDEAKDKNLIA